VTIEQLEDEEYGYCGACETNPAQMENAIEAARRLAGTWHKTAAGFPKDSVTRKLLRHCANELVKALKAPAFEMPADVKADFEEAGVETPS
jgi:hypothetical protein